MRLMARAIQPSDVKRYGIAALLVMGTVVLELAVRPLFGGRAPLLLFTIAVTVAASYGGLGPGLFATALSIACVEWIFANLVFSLVPIQPSVGFFAALAVGISLIIANFRNRNAALASAKARLESANRELARSAERMQQSNEELKRFAYALSHDLQNPLRTIGIFTERLALQTQGKLDEEGETSIRYVLDGVRRSQEMIRSLLEYSTAAHGVMTESAVDLNAVLASARADLVVIAENARACIISDSLPVVRGDARQLQRVFSNLLSNAIKYGGENPPEIHIGARKAGKEWTISVRDNGIGFDMQYAEKVFGLFERLHSAAQYEGSGIGLAVCYSIVQRHGGRMWAESKKGSGSTFFFTLPASVSR